MYGFLTYSVRHYTVQVKFAPRALREGLVLRRRDINLASDVHFGKVAFCH